MLALRHLVPESPRWQVTHGFEEAAHRNTQEIEEKVERSGGGRLPPAQGTLTIRPQRTFGIGLVLGVMLHRHRGRSLLVLALMVSQAFLYNAVFFTYGLVLTKFHHVPDQSVGTYILPLTLGNLLGPLVLAHLFDSVGRKPMIAGTYGLAGVLLVAVGLLFGFDLLTAWTQTFCWMAIFFVASAAAVVGLSDRERNIPAGDARHGDRDLLRTWHADRRRHGAGCIWMADRHRQPMGRRERLPDRRRFDDRRRDL